MQPLFLVQKVQFITLEMGTCLRWNPTNLTPQRMDTQREVSSAGCRICYLDQQCHHKVSTIDLNKFSAHFISIFGFVFLIGNAITHITHPNHHTTAKPIDKSTVCPVYDLKNNILNNLVLTIKFTQFRGFSAGCLDSENGRSTAC